MHNDIRNAKLRDMNFCLKFLLFSLLGITQKLDYLVDIGVTAIWITPFFDSPLESGGYDITNYIDVQHIFGTIDDFRDLLNAAHSKSIYIHIIYILCYIKLKSNHIIVI